MELLEHGHHNSIRRGRRTIIGIMGRTKQQTPPPNPPRHQDLSRDYGPDGAADRLSLSTLRHAHDTPTRPSGSGQTES